jgi:hypothetical protein
MRWLDIILPQPRTNKKLDRLVEQALAGIEELERIQQRDGLDNITVTEQMAAIGRLLFQALTLCDENAFNPAASEHQTSTPLIGDETHDQLVGFHIVAGCEWPELPWAWTHNGLGFLLEKHPISSSPNSASLPEPAECRPWMERCRRAEFLVDEEGASSLAGTLEQLRQEAGAPPEFLFVPGHMESQVRRMIFREAEAITHALDRTSLPAPLARVHLPKDPITPQELSGQSLTYQALHFAGPTSFELGTESDGQPDWMDQMIEDLNAPEVRELEDAMGIEGEVLGVDPITSLLDDVSQRFEEGQLAGGHGYLESSAGGGSGPAPGGGTPGISDVSNPGRDWLLDDGPVEPESLSKSGLVPPLIYSNSYCALPHLGRRFLAAGASTFIGPLAPLFSRPARIFSGYCYQALGDGWCAGAAVWKAANSCREELGKEHPAWLSYGIRGYGSLALPYL